MPKITVPLTLLALVGIPALSQQPSSMPLKPHVQSAVGFGNDTITHLADGGGWKTSITLMNLAQTKTAVFVLNFYANDGSPLVLSFDGIGRASQLTGTLAVGGSIAIKTSGSGAAITQGWAQFDFFKTTDSLAGFAVFVNSNGNEAAVPFEDSIAGDEVLSFDNTNGYGMGVALASSYFQAATITATFRDANGNIIGTSKLTLPAMGHASFVFTDQWPFTAGKQGTVLLQSSGFGLAVLGLRFTPQGTFTSVTAFEKWTVD